MAIDQPQLPLANPPEFQLTHFTARNRFTAVLDFCLQRWLLVKSLQVFQSIVIVPTLHRIRSVLIIDHFGLMILYFRIVLSQQNSDWLLSIIRDRLVWRQVTRPVDLGSSTNWPANSTQHNPLCQWFWKDREECFVMSWWNLPHIRQLITIFNQWLMIRISIRDRSVYSSQ